MQNGREQSGALERSHRDCIPSNSQTLWLASADLTGEDEWEDNVEWLMLKGGILLCRYANM